eukprot:13617021-Alexandrium_andersonii.AAC.1
MHTRTCALTHARHGTAPHRKAPHRTAPHRIAIHRIVPHPTAPHRTSPHRTDPHQAAPRHTTSTLWHAQMRGRADCRRADVQTSRRADSETRACTGN